MTERMIAAIEHPLIDAIGHPTGRKIQSRAPYAVDIERVIEAAARTGTMLEINSAPDRRDLNDVHARDAARGGRADRHRLRRPRRQHADPHPLGHRDRAPGVADQGRRGQHAAVGASSRRCASAAAAPSRRGSSSSRTVASTAARR